MTISIAGVDEIEKKLNSLSDVMKTKLLRKVANKIASISKKRITAQTDLAGKAWIARSPNTEEAKIKKKMLTGLRQRLRVLSVTDSQAVIGFSGLALKIAGEQQYGLKDKPTTSNTRNQGNSSLLPATKRQALALKKLGFEVKKKKVSVKWIVDHLTMGKAAAIIRIMRTAADTANRSQFLPARSFLGVNADDEKVLMQLITDEINQTIN